VERGADSGPGHVDSNDVESVFIGFGGDSARLYEFETSAGHRVDVNDMDCISIEFRPLTRDLVVTFEGIETHELPREVVSFTFTDAAVYQWEDNPASADVLAEQGERLRGQVNDFDYLGSGCFTLSIFDQVMAWKATSVRYEVAIDPRRVDEVE